MAELTVRPLGPDTWDAFARLVECHNGVWGGCWCVWFHGRDPATPSGADGHRARKERLVREGRTHAAVVFDGDDAVGWCQYGPPEELPRIAHRKEYDAGLVTAPDHRITCFFVDRARRGQGVSAVALRGALDLIAGAGGGLVESYPQDTGGAKVSSGFLWNGSRALFERAGFTYQRPKGAHHCVMTMNVEAR